jgi:hypothetical protein
MRVRVYPADAFLLADAFLPSAPTVKKCVCADVPLRPREPERVRADISESAQTRPCVRADITASQWTRPYVSADATMRPRRYRRSSAPPCPSPLPFLLALRRRVDASSYQRECSKKYKKIFKKKLVFVCWKR